MPFIGPGVRLHGPFSCVLPGHRDARPSASLYRDPRTGVWRYRDWHALESRREWWSLAEVYASVTAAPIRLRAPSASRWYDRLFWRAGVLHAPPPPVVPLPARSAPILHRVAVGFAELLTLRAVRDPGEPVVYTRTFAAPWCGVGVDQAKRAIAELRRLDVLRKVGETQEGNPRFFLYELGTGPRRRRHPTLADGARRTAKVGEAPAR